MEHSKIAILGSTGSVGRQALDALSAIKHTTVLLTGGGNISLLADQARITKAERVAVPTESAASELKTLLSDTDTKVYGGKTAICDCIAECGADLIVHSISGMAGISSAIAASKTGARLAIANKESIISLGDEIYKNIRAFNGELIPVDSEHSAIFQCLCTSGAIDSRGNSKPELVKRILLTASGGPFFGKTRIDLEKVTPQMALAHPTWRMGQKITIDCATLMNKGFEVIEAVRLFKVDIEKVEVLIHRQSIIHSMVEYIDTMVMAQLGTPDMRHCVRYALTYPDRMKVNEPGLDFASIEKLSFDRPDNNAFPLLDLSYKAYRMGGNAPAALISADEAAVKAFIGGKLSFNGISDVVTDTLEKFSVSSECTVESVFCAEREAGRIAGELINARAS